MAVLLGSLAQAGANDSFGAGDLGATKATAAASGTLDLLRMVIRASAFSTLRLAIYADDGTGNSPGALLGISNTTADNTAGTKDLTMVSGVAITNGVSYWVALLTTGSYVDWTGVGAGNGYDYRSATGLTAFPDPWGTSDGDSPTTIPIQGESSGGAAVTPFIPHRMPLGV